jgi:hypothetical protein
LFFRERDLSQKGRTTHKEVTKATFKKVKHILKVISLCKKGKHFHAHEEYKSTLQYNKWALGARSKEHDLPI